MATQDQVLAIFQRLMLMGYTPPKGAPIEAAAALWAEVLHSIDHEALSRALSDEVQASGWWPKLPAVVGRLGKASGAPSAHEASEVLPLLMRLQSSSHYRRSNDPDYDPIADLYPFGGPRVTALRRALLSARGWKGLAQMPADLGDDPRACADIRKTYQSALAEEHARHRRDGLPIPPVSMGDMLRIEQEARQQRRQLALEAHARRGRPALTDGAKKRERPTGVATLVEDLGAGMRLLGVD